MDWVLDIDLRVYSLDALKKALYRFSDRFSATISLDGEFAKCVLNFTGSASPEFIAVVIDGFKKELLDQDLRERIRDETADVRNLILAHAFSKTGLISDEPV